MNVMIPKYNSVLIWHHIAQTSDRGYNGPCKEKLPNLPNLPKCTLRFGGMEVGSGYERKV
jgi:hypothetical protein